MKQIHTFISLYFNLSRKEANGFIVLCFLIPIFIFLPWIGRLCFYSPQVLSVKDLQAMNGLSNQTEKDLKTKKYASLKTPSPKEIVLTNFNPNVANETEMIHAGVPDFVASRIIKFRNKGGVFKTKEDLKKIYGLQETVYKKIYPYITLATSSTQQHATHIPTQTKRQSIQPFDLNKADSLTLVALKGIGPTLATRIIKYRLKLGGFISATQLQEVYGLDSTALNDIYKYGYIDQNFIPAKLDLNSSDEKPFRDHPYIGKKIAAIIFNYRDQHGHFINTEQLRNIKSISEQTYTKILPYLK